MRIELTISKIDSELISAFATLDNWFDHTDPLLQEVMEYVIRSNRYFLTLIDKEDWTAMDTSCKDFNEQLSFYLHPNLFNKKNVQPYSFDSQCLPKEMQDCTRPLKEIRRELRDQLYRCLCYLDTLSLESNTHFKNITCESHAYHALYLIALYIKMLAAQLDEHFSQLH